jgi:hypothetical protein
MNRIVEIRKEIATYLDLNSKIKDSEATILSPTEKYRIETAEFKQTKPDTNWEITRVEIFDHATGEKLFSFFSNWGAFFHSWVTKNNVDYLLCAEDIYGGQTIIDLTNKKNDSYSSGEDGFIGTGYYISPNAEVLGVVGCYWACPYVIKFYKFDKPLQLPLPEFHEIELRENLNDKISWADNETIVFKNENSGRERVEKIRTAHNTSHNSLRGLE